MVEELLRYLSVVQLAFPRFAKRDMEIDGHPLRGRGRGAGLAQRGQPGPGRAGADPEVFDPARVPSSGHLAFGHGIHRCIGAELARMELRIVLPALLRRFPDLALAVPPEQLAFRPLSFVYGIDELPVTL